MKYYGHNDVRLMNGGRRKWLEEKRALRPTRRNSADHILGEVSETSIRAKREDIFSVLREAFRGATGGRQVPDEYTGKVIAPPGMTEPRSGGGHIPARPAFRGRKRVAEDRHLQPATRSANSTAARASLGTGSHRLLPLGERSCIRGFVLKYLLGYKKSGTMTVVDGVGNLVGAPSKGNCRAAR